jgi:putative aldouronate transport system permease protein
MDAKRNRFTPRRGRPAFLDAVARDFRLNKSLYLLFLPVIVYYAVFHYYPMYGAQIAFKNFMPALGIFHSPWVGFLHFQNFFDSYYFWRILKNTVIISFTNLIFGFPAPIILALLINELRHKYYQRFVQTITYMPHFISMVVICGMIHEFTKSDGLVTVLLGYLGFPQQHMLNNPHLFVPVYVISGIWQEAGWGSIIYLATLAGLDQELYEAAAIDGAGRWRQTLHITMPGILPTIVILFILRMGKMLNVGYEKIILLYNPVTYETADVISSFVYRKGILEFNFSYSTAVGLFNSVINLALLITANSISKRVSETSLW